MASASSINTVSANGNKNYISGLASGMDTDSIVESLLLGTQICVPSSRLSTILSVSIPEARPDM